MACKSCVCDFAKVIIPAGWGIVSLAATAIYVLVPVLDDRQPRYIPAALALFSAFTSLASAIDIWRLWRTAAYSSHLAAPNPARAKSLRTEQIVIACIAFLTLALLLVLAIDGSNLGICGHDSCGADVSWTAISLLFVLLWLVVVHTKYRKEMQAANTSKDGTEMVIAGPDEPQV